MMEPSETQPRRPFLTVRRLALVSHSPPPHFPPQESTRQSETQPLTESHRSYHGSIPVRIQGILYFGLQCFDRSLVADRTRRREIRPLVQQRVHSLDDGTHI